MKKLGLVLSHLQKRVITNRLCENLRRERRFDRVKLPIFERRSTFLDAHEAIVGCETGSPGWRFRRSTSLSTRPSSITRHRLFAANTLNRINGFELWFKIAKKFHFAGLSNEAETRLHDLASLHNLYLVTWSCFEAHQSSLTNFAFSSH